MLIAIKLSSLALYVLIGIILDNRAYQHLKDPDADIWDPPIARPRKFTPEGEAHRRRAMRFWVGGGIVVGLIFWLEI